MSFADFLLNSLFGYSQKITIQRSIRSIDDLKLVILQRCWPLVVIVTKQYKGYDRYNGILQTMYHSTFNGCRYDRYTAETLPVSYS